MPKTELQRRFLIRKIIAVVALCLFFLRGLSFLGMAASLTAAPQTGGMSFSQFILGEHCEAAKNDAHPRNHDHERTGCCVLCMSTARDAIVLSVLVLAQVIAGSPRQGVEPAAFSIENLTALKTPGLNSSWSATSPPSLAKFVTAGL